MQKVEMEEAEDKDDDKPHGRCCDWCGQSCPRSSLTSSNICVQCVGECEGTILECPGGHTLQSTMTDTSYECDSCGKRLGVGRRIFDCRACDFTLCKNCAGALARETAY